MKKVFDLRWQNTPHLVALPDGTFLINGEPVGDLAVVGQALRDIALAAGADLDEYAADPERGDLGGDEFTLVRVAWEG